jgi:acetoin utilization protein AcuB
MLKVRDLMTKGVITVGPDDPLRVAIRKMIAGRFRRIPVLAADGLLVGIITDRDIRQALNSPVVFHERSHDEYLLNTVKVESSMTLRPLTISPDQDILAAAELMEQKKIGGLPVIEEGALVGIITLSDLINFLISHLKKEQDNYQS